MIERTEKRKTSNATEPCDVLLVPVGGPDFYKNRRLWSSDMTDL